MTSDFGIKVEVGVEVGWLLKSLDLKDLAFWFYFQPKSKSLVFGLQTFELGVLVVGGHLIFVSQIQIQPKHFWF